MKSSDLLTQLTRKPHSFELDRPDVKRMGSTLAKASAKKTRKSPLHDLTECIEQVRAAGERLRITLERVPLDTAQDPREHLVDELSPPLPIPSEAQVVLAHRSATLRAELLSEFGGFASDEIAKANSRARNLSALPSRWRDEKRIFRVHYRSQTLHPGFQFDEDLSPKPVIQSILNELPTDAMTEWEIAFWFVSANEELDGQRPVDLINNAPQRVIAAAAAESQPLEL